MHATKTLLAAAVVAAGGFLTAGRAQAQCDNRQDAEETELGVPPSELWMTAKAVQHRTSVEWRAGPVKPGGRHQPVPGQRGGRPRILSIHSQTERPDDRAEPEEL